MRHGIVANFEFSGSFLKTSRKKNYSPRYCLKGLVEMSNSLVRLERVISKGNSLLQPR